MTAGWIEGRFEGVYAGKRLPRRGAPRNARRFQLELRSGTVHELERLPGLSDVAVPPAPEDAELAREIRQERLEGVKLALEDGEDGFEECTLFDLHVRDFTLSHPAESNGQAYGTVAGRIRARLSPPEPETSAAPDDALDEALDEGVAATEPEAGSPTQLERRRHGSEVDATDAEVLYARLRWLAVFFALLVVTAGIALACGAHTAVIFASPVVGALVARLLTRHAQRTAALAGGLGAIVVALQALLLLPLALEWHDQGCFTVRDTDLLLLGAPVVLAGLLGGRWPLALCSSLWLAVVCVQCANLGGACTGPPVPPSAAVGKRAGGPDGAQAPGSDAAAPTTSAAPRTASVAGGPGSAHAAPKRTDERGRWPVMPSAGGGAGAPGAGPAGTLSPGGGAAPAPPALPGAAAGPPNASSPGGVQPPSAAAATTPGGWVAADHRRAPRELVLISVEHANRTPDEFFDGQGTRRVYLPTDPIFEAGDSRVTREGDLQLARLAALLNLKPQTTVTLEVHTDSAGGAGPLSERRATALRAWLIDRGHLAAGQFAVEALGGVRPLVPPDGSHAAQQPNRRIEVRLGS